MDMTYLNNRQSMVHSTLQLYNNRLPNRQQLAQIWRLRYDVEKKTNDKLKQTEAEIS